MSDTSHEMEQKMLSMLAERTPAERLRMAAGMFDTGIALLNAGIRSNCPDISEAEMRAQVFLRLYGDCFSEQESKKIIQHLRNIAENRA